LVKNSQPRVVGTVHLFFEAFIHGLAFFADIANTRLAQVNVVVVKVWLCSATEADIASLTDRATTITDIAGELVCFCVLRYALRLQIVSQTL
jgi:hypothetical protein